MFQLLLTNLHVVETVEGFVTDSARKLGGPNEDLLRSRDPISTVNWRGRRFGGSGGGGKTNVEGHCYTTQVIGARFLLMITHSRRVFWVRGSGFEFVLTRRAKGEGNGIFIVNFVSF